MKKSESKTQGNHFRLLLLRRRVFYDSSLVFIPLILLKAFRLLPIGTPVQWQRQ